MLFAAVGSETVTEDQVFVILPVISRMPDILTIINENASRAERPTDLLGARGESLAAEYLIRSGYRLVVSNFTVPVGRNSQGAQVTGEIDLIALDGGTLCFIEVKTRRSDEFASPTANVDLRKQRQIIRTARVYRRIFNIREMNYRFDVVSILMPFGGEPQIELFRGFWNEAKFRKRAWNQEPWREYI